MPDSSDNVNSGARASGTVDWSRPIEAVHEDGRVVPVDLGGERNNPDSQGDYYTIPSLRDGGPGIWRPDGTTWCGADRGWRIRNVQPTTPERDPALWDRMVALVRRMCHVYVQTDRAEYPDYAEARAIVADLAPPDPVEAIVDELMRKDCTTRQAIEEAVRRGRELARQGNAA